MNIIHPDINDTQTGIFIDETYYALPLSRQERSDIANVYGIRDPLRHTILGVPSDSQFFSLVQTYKTQEPKPRAAINSEEGANKEKTEEEKRRQRTIAEAHLLDDIEDAKTTLDDYKRRTNIYIAASLVALSVLFVGVFILAMISVNLGAPLAVIGALGSVPTVVATAQRFQSNQIAEKRATLRRAQRKLRDFQT